MADRCNLCGRFRSEKHKCEFSKDIPGLSKKLSEKFSGKGNPFFGKKHSEEFKEAMKKIKIGKKLSEEVRNKMKIKRIGKKPSLGMKHTEEHKHNMRIRFSGENNPSWLGGKSFEPYNKNFNNLFKENIKARDNDSCVLCGYNKKLAIHHIDYNKLNSIKENCISLCESCHAKTNFNRKYWKEFFESMLSDKYSYFYNKINMEILNGDKNNGK